MVMRPVGTVAMANQSIPTFPDALYDEQAAYLAEHTDLTPKEAEAYLRRAHIPDDKRDRVLDRELAKDMGVSRATFSKHLGNAQDKLEGEEAIIDSLTTLLLTTDLGGAGAPSRQVVAAEKTMNAFLLVTETEFYDREQYNFPSKYKAHLVYRDLQDPDIDFDELPDDIIHHDKYSIFTVESSGKQHFLKSVVAYIDALDALDEYDLIAAADLLEDNLHIEPEGTASDIIQDASGVIMSREGQH